MSGEKEQSQYTGNFDATPENGGKPKESLFWRFFNAVVKQKIPFLYNGLKKYGKNFYTAKNEVIKAEAEEKRADAEIKRAKAQKKLAEAAILANQAKGIDIDNFRKMNDNIVDIHSKQNLPDDVKTLLTYASISKDPAILEQIQKLNNMGDVLSAVNFASINLKINDDHNIDSSIETPSYDNFEFPDTYEEFLSIEVSTIPFNSETKKMLGNMDGIMVYGLLNDTNYFLKELSLKNTTEYPVFEVGAFLQKAELKYNRPIFHIDHKFLNGPYLE